MSWSTKQRIYQILQILRSRLPIQARMDTAMKLSFHSRFGLLHRFIF